LYLEVEQPGPDARVRRVVARDAAHLADRLVRPRLVGHVGRAWRLAERAAVKRAAVERAVVVREVVVRAEVETEAARAVVAQVWWRGVQ